MKSHLQPELTEKKAYQATALSVGQAHGRRGGRFEGGAVMPMTIVALVVLIGIAGLVVDFAPVFLDKNKLQHAADSAALAGAEYLRANEPVTETIKTTAKKIAKDVFNAQKPESAPSVTEVNVKIDGDKVSLSVGSAHATSFIRVLPGGISEVNVAAESEAGQVVSDVGKVCLSPLVICTSSGNELKPTSPNYTNFDVGNNAFILCGDKEGNASCTSKIDDKLAQDNKSTDPTKGQYCEFTLPGKIARGKATGQVRAGINSRFFDCGDMPKNGFTDNCKSGYLRDRYSWTGRNMSRNSANQASQFGSLTYSNYILNQNTTKNRDVYGNTSVQANTAPYRRLLYVAEVKANACANEEIKAEDYKLWCMFLRRPSGANEGTAVWLEILDPAVVDCEELAKAPGGTAKRKATRTLN